MLFSMQFLLLFYRASSKISLTIEKYVVKVIIIIIIIIIIVIVIVIIIIIIIQAQKRKKSTYRSHREMKDSRQCLPHISHQ